MLIPRLNELILQLAPRYECSDSAPGTYSDLLASRTGGVLQVWPGASDSTIYGCPRVNHAFRAWHDSLHIQLGAEFTLAGEVLVAQEQARLLGGDILGAIVLAEVVGQAEYYAVHGEFPGNQVRFIREYLHSKGVRI